MALMNLLYLLPKNTLSRLVGKLMHLKFRGRLGRKINLLMVATFARVYRINLIEAEKELDQYPSIGDFFVRKLKPGMRPLQQGFFLHPADSRISQIAPVIQGQLLQAKGKLFSINALLSQVSAEEQYRGGMFATYYLCPTDYHRVHSPVTGRITSVVLMPGYLWPVNSWSVERIDQLFCVNERVIVNIEVPARDKDPAVKSAFVSLVLVGATNVGKISLNFEPRILSNQTKQRERLEIIYPEPLLISQGQEIGMFHMGSTVVAVMSSGLLPSLSPEQLQAGICAAFRGRQVKMGESLF